MAEFSFLCAFNYSEFILISKVFNVFKEVSYAHQGCIYLIKNTEKNPVIL